MQARCSAHAKTERDRVVNASMKQRICAAVAKRHWSGLEASSNEALELKEEKDFDVELEGNHDFDYGRDPFEYLFYR